MQIDFHHATTYVIARLAGFDSQESEIIAHSAQYVDDATSSGETHFDNKALYRRISSAHRMIDIRNTEEAANHLVWMPFHFLPGNGGKKAGNNPAGNFIEKIVCRPNSPIAQDMVKQAIVDQDHAFGLHQLGVAMHVYADTWAHQGFAGVLHKINDVEDALETGNSGVFSGGLMSFLRDILDDAIPPLGHGRAEIFPDMPFLSWEYKNGHGETVSRNNTRDFLEAADHLCIAMRRYRAKNPQATVPGLPDEDRDKMKYLFSSILEKSGESRHAKWLEYIADGYFSFGAEYIAYPGSGITRGKGRNSWKEQALGTSYNLPVHTYKKDFLSSNWKLFHDAIQAHRLYVIHDLLPKYGICAA